MAPWNQVSIQATPRLDSTETTSSSTTSDWICDAFEDVFHIEISNGGVANPNEDRVMNILGYGKGVTCYDRPVEGSKEAKWDEKRGSISKVGKPLVSFIPPTGKPFLLDSPAF